MKRRDRWERTDRMGEKVERLEKNGEEREGRKK